eukprot:TRINITY_DN21593_c0_g1_i1.p1 TRINITY_DN21593_c0_g1~~TRINITY_DN21593_c0_g1_i1.p1  ORF type:complete len:622 (+),score=99.48 TRINITY_DN21593_c0_g1_i1:164-2029(+)
MPHFAGDPTCDWFPFLRGTGFFEELCWRKLRRQRFRSVGIFAVFVGVLAQVHGQQQEENLDGQQNLDKKLKRVCNSPIDMLTVPPSFGSSPLSSSPSASSKAGMKILGVPPPCAGSITTAAPFVGMLTAAPTSGQVMATTLPFSTRTTTPSHYLLPSGDSWCPDGLAVTSRDECAFAVNFLGFLNDPLIVLSDPDYPNGCSCKIGACGGGAQEACAVFNHHASEGSKHLDFSPICKSTLPGRDASLFSKAISSACCTTKRRLSTTRTMASADYVYGRPEDRISTSTTTSTVTTTTTTTTTTSATTTTTTNLWHLTTTTSASTTTATTTTTTSSLTSVTSSTSTTTTISTSTTSCSSSTTMTTRTTTTTTSTRTTSEGEPPPLPCGPPCPRLPIRPDACQALPSDETCEVTTISSYCLDPVKLILRCPMWNDISSRPPDVLPVSFRDGDNFLRLVRCSICSLRLDAPKDLDPRPRWIMAEITFGPNMRDGIPTEVGIDQYRVFVTDHDGSRLQNMLEVLNVSKGANIVRNSTQCCDVSAYRGIRVVALLPLNVTEVRLEVVPVVDGHAMPAGLVTDPVIDWFDNAFVRVTSGTQLPISSFPLVVAVWAATVAALFAALPAAS